MASIAFQSSRRTSSRFFPLAAASVVAASAYAFYQSNKPQRPAPSNSRLLMGAAPLFAANSKQEHSKEEYQKVYNAIADKIQEYDGYDNGIGFGPALVRLAWHQAGTYIKADGCPMNKVGGSFGGTMRHEKEGLDGANNGLQNARWLVHQVKKDYPWISYGDLYTLSGVVAVQEMQGPKVGWRAGREDLDASYAMTNRLPDAAQGPDYVRDFFQKRGLNDREIVSLIGAHALGSCHVKAPGLPTGPDGEEGPSTGPGSGYLGPWTYAPNVFSNDFFKLLLEEKWEWKKWNGPKQYVNANGLMMLPADMAIVQDAKFKKYVEYYAKDQDQYFKDFAKDFQKLLELGIDFGKKESWYFKTLDEQS